MSELYFNTYINFMQHTFMMNIKRSSWLKARYHKKHFWNQFSDLFKD